MKIYLAGKITGDPDYKAKFARAKARLELQGFIVLDPSHNPIGLSKEEYMAIDLPMLRQADAAYFLRDWRDSAGANLEMRYCEYVEKMIILEGADR